MALWINVVTAALAFGISAATGIFLIPLLKKLHFGQTIEKFVGAALESQKKKQGTPMMGGFMFIIGSLVAGAVGFLLWRATAEIAVPMGKDLPLYRILTCMGFALLNSGIGFIDDYIKAVKKQNKGLNPKQKMVMQLVLTSAFLWVLKLLGDDTKILLPFFGDVDFGIFYYPLMILVLIYIVNAVNLTDGVDGLCSTVTVVSSLSFVMMLSVLGLWECTIFGVAVAGGCVGFLVWNLHPAKVFMGDTGSMYLGGAVAALGMMTGQHLLFFLVAIVYICEALSVVLQVISFKTTGKRIFKMSPIHHHFELCNWSEYKIVIVFSLVGLLAGVIANVIMML